MNPNNIWDLDNWIRWEPSPARDAFWDWWNHGFFGFASTPCCGHWSGAWYLNLPQPWNWGLGLVLFTGMIFGPLFLWNWWDNRRSK